MRGKPVLGALLAFAATGAIAADKEAEFPTLVEEFGARCLMPGVEAADRLAAIEADTAWTELESVTLDVEAMEISRALSRNYRFKDPVSVRQWTGEIDGKTAHLLLAKFEEKQRYDDLCAIVVNGVQNAMPYGRDLRGKFEEFGIKGKSVDLVHYYEFAGKLKPGTHPVAEKHAVRGEIFSRSQAGGAGNTTHIYIAY